MDENLTDEELVRQYLDTGNEEAIGLLYHKYYPTVVYVCNKYLENKHDSEDAAMEVFTNLPELLKKFEIKQFRKWLYSIVRNECRMVLRKKKSSSITIQESVEWPEFVEKTEAVHPVDKRKERLQWITEAMTTLEGEVRICVALFYAEDKTYIEISEITGWEIRHIKNCLQTARRQIKNFIEGKDKQHENVYG
jgi:RNA polymerase sigma-70 factor (ECF subfamily)